MKASLREAKFKPPDARKQTYDLHTFTRPISDRLKPGTGLSFSSRKDRHMSGCHPDGIPTIHHVNYGSQETAARGTFAGRLRRHDYAFDSWSPSPQPHFSGGRAARRTADRATHVRPGPFRWSVAPNHL